MSRMESLERRVLDALPITIYTVDVEGRITGANRAWRRFAVGNGAPLLADDGSIVGRAIWDAISDDGAREQLRRAMAQLREGRADLLSWEFPCSSPTEERVFLLQLSPLRDGEALAGFVFSTIDITASHRSREALIDAGIALSRTIGLERAYQEVAAQLRRAVPCEGVAIALADDETAALALVWQSGFDLPREALEARLAPAWLAALADGRPVTRSADGRLEITAPMTSIEGVLGAMTVAAEPPGSVQRREEAERVLATIAAQTAAAIERAWLVRRVEQKRRLEAVGEVSAGIAHELRNPLFGISSAAQLLRFRANQDPVVEKNVGRILREVERLNRMVTSLLEYGRPQPPRLAPGDPDAVWDDVLEENRGRLESKSLRLERTRSRVRASCAIDPEQLKQVFLNVLVNAVEAAPGATDLALESTLLPSGAWRCRLRNDGPAIPPEVLPRVFEIFFSTKSGGTGIGLALCQRIVEEHRGSIGIESAPERGTAVTIVLPAAAAAVPA